MHFFRALHRIHTTSRYFDVDQARRTAQHRLCASLCVQSLRCICVGLALAWAFSPGSLAADEATVSIKESIERDLADAVRVGTPDLKVTERRGHVILSGTVDSFMERCR